MLKKKENKNDKTSELVYYICKFQLQIMQSLFKPVSHLSIS